MKTLLSFVYFCGAVGVSLLIGKLLAHFIGVLPASLYGMLVFCVLLSSGLLKTEKIAPWANFSFTWMPLVFLPICVGVMEYGDILRQYGLIVLISGLVTVLLTLAGVGLCSQILLHRIYGETFSNRTSATKKFI